MVHVNSQQRGKGNSMLERLSNNKRNGIMSLEQEGWTRRARKPDVLAWLSNSV